MKLFVVFAAIGLWLSANVAGQTVDADAHKRATDVLEKSIDTYRKAPAITDSLAIEVNFPGFNQRMTFEIAMDDKGGASVVSENVNIVAKDKAVYVQDVKLPNKYLQIDVKKDVKSALEQVRIGVPFHFTMRAETEPSFDDLLQSFNAGGAGGWVVKKVEETKTEDGATRTVLDLTSPGGTMQIQIDPATNFIRSVYMTQGIEGANDYGTVAMTLDPALHDALPKAIAFDTTGKKRVPSMLELALGVGDPAPDFTLESSENKKVTLSDLRGNVVVLDFWATWCGPCIMGLPKLQEFDQWTKTSGLPIKVFAVNVWERLATPEERKSAALGFWQSRGFSMPTLLDLERTVADAYGFQSIPTTVIVAPDGTITAMHNGFSQNMVELLKKDVEAALEAKVPGAQSAR